MTPEVIDSSFFQIKIDEKNNQCLFDYFFLYFLIFYINKILF